MQYDKTFFLVTPRSGSSMFADMIGVGAHPLKQSRLSPKHAELNEESYAKFIYFVETGGLSGLLKSFYEEAGHCLITLLMQAKFKFIYLTRRNILRQTMSGAQAGQTGIWHATAEKWEEADVALTENDVRRSLFGYAKHNALAEEFFSAFGIKPLRLYYEDHLESPKYWDEMKRTLEMFLGRELKFETPKRQKLSGAKREAFYLDLLGNPTFAYEKE